MQPPPRLRAVLSEFEHVQEEDPRRVRADGRERGREAVYAERVTARLAALDPEASELLQAAARAQHLRRWDIPRPSYPEGRQGYEAWRRACREHHVAVAAPILARNGYSADEIARIAALIRKENLKTDPESQALEDAVALVFLEHDLDAFLEKYSTLSEEKSLGILRKTLRKMSAKGREAATALPFRPELRVLIEKALGAPGAIRS